MAEGRKIPYVRPLLGMWKADSADDIPDGASPDMQNFSVWQGTLIKRPGYVQFKAGNASIGGSVTGLCSTKDDQDNSRLYATFATGLRRFNVGTNQWDLMTGPALTGAASQLMSFEISQNNLVFSQGVDNIMALPLNSTTYAAISANSKPSRYLTRFADRLFAGFTTEGGATKPFRVRWPVSSDHTDWTGVGSGFRDNSEQPYFIRGMMKLVQQLAVYTEKSIWVASRTGGLPPAQFDMIVSDTGLLSPFTLQGRNSSHLFLGNDDFYEFNGARTISIAPQIREYIFGQLNAGAALQNFGVILNDTQEWAVFLCTGAQSTPNIVWVYNMARGGIWYPWTVSGPTCAAVHRLDTTTTIDQLIGTISEQNWEFDSRQQLAAYPALLTGHSDGKIYQWGTTSLSDNGAAIDAYWSSKDYRCADVDQNERNKFITIHGVTVTYVDSGTPFNLDLYYSTDGGITYQGPYTESLGGITSGSVRHKTFWKQCTGESVRFRVRNNTATDVVRLISFQPILELGKQIY